MEYRVFQDAVEELARRDTAWRGVFPRGRQIEAKDDLPLPSNEIGLSHLLSALKDILEDAPREEFPHVPKTSFSSKEVWTTSARVFEKKQK